MVEEQEVGLSRVHKEMTDILPFQGLMQKGLKAVKKNLIWTQYVKFITKKDDHKRYLT